MRKRLSSVIFTLIAILFAISFSAAAEEAVNFRGITWSSTVDDVLAAENLTEDEIESANGLQLIMVPATTFADEIAIPHYIFADGNLFTMGYSMDSDPELVIYGKVRDELIAMYGEPDFDNLDYILHLINSFGGNFSSDRDFPWSAWKASDDTILFLIEGDGSTNFAFFHADTTEPAGESGNEADYDFMRIGEGEVGITKYTGSDSAVVIPGTLGGGTVRVIGKEAFADNRDLRTVIIPDGVRQIGSEAFRSCGSLIWCLIPESVTEIDEYAFDDSDVILRVIPDSEADRYARGVMGTRNIEYVRKMPLTSSAEEKPGFDTPDACVRAVVDALIAEDIDAFLDCYAISEFARGFDANIYYKESFSLMFSGALLPTDSNIAIAANESYLRNTLLRRVAGTGILLNTDSDQIRSFIRGQVISNSHLDPDTDFVTLISTGNSLSQLKYIDELNVNNINEKPIAADFMEFIRNYSYKNSERYYSRQRQVFGAVEFLDTVAILEWNGEPVFMPLALVNVGGYKVAPISSFIAVLWSMPSGTLMLPQASMR